MKLSSKFPWLLAAALMVSVLANLFLLRQVRNLYASRLLSQIAPLGTPTLPVVTGEINHPTATVLLYGDSRMAAWEMSPLAGIRLVNAGINGATTSQLRLQLPALLSEFKPDVMVLQAGINDLKLVGIRPELKPALTMQAATNLLEICRECLTNRCQVILLKTWPTGPPEWARIPLWNRHVPEAVGELNAELIREGERHSNLHVVDLISESDHQPEPSDYQDALHFQPEFYVHLTPPLEHWIQKLLSEKQTSVQ